MSEIKEIIEKGRKGFKTSEGNEVLVKLLPMSKGIKVSKQLISLLAPAIGSMADGVRHDEFLHGAPTSFSNLAYNLVGQLDKIDVLELIDALFEGLMVNKAEVDVEEYFSGNYGEMVEILEFALKENFQTFFTGKGMKARLTTAVKALMQGSIQAESESE